MLFQKVERAERSGVHVVVDAHGTTEPAGEFHPELEPLEAEVDGMGDPARAIVDGAGDPDTDGGEADDPGLREFRELGDGSNRGLEHGIRSEAGGKPESLHDRPGRVDDDGIGLGATDVDPDAQRAAGGEPRIGV